MNKHGYTLIELLVVIVIIGLILLFVYPLLDEMIGDNNKELYTQYENMMIEYAKVSDNKATSAVPDIYLKLSELDGLEQIKNECRGYVHIKYINNKPNTYTSYISCNDGYQTVGYDINFE